MPFRIKQTTLCYLEQDGKYLMLYRNKKKEDANQGKWIAVGGKFEYGESPEDCMEREVFEETGLKVEEYRYCGVVTFVSDTWPSEMMHLFVCTKFDGTLQECSEGELRWFNKEELLNLPMWEGDKIFLQLLLDNVPFFSLKLRYVGEKLEECFFNGKPYKELLLKENIYRHFKGNLYKVLGEVLDSETAKPSIVYQALYGEKKVWVRSKEMFFENVVVNGISVPRFSLVKNQEDLKNE